MSVSDNTMRAIFPFTCRLIGDSLNGIVGKATEAEDVPGFLEREQLVGAPEYIADLARLELAVFLARSGTTLVSVRDGPKVNPTLRILSLSWKNLYMMLDNENPARHPVLPETETLLVWQMPRSGAVTARPAMNHDLIALKIAVEELSPESAAETGHISPAQIRSILDHAGHNGLLIMPASRICRDLSLFTNPKNESLEYASADFFTLQWHITQACDLRCAHCYDRSDRQMLDLDMALRILHQLEEFCGDRHVRGQVSFTGGNPLLYPHFMRLYREAANRGFYTAILGNPAPEEIIEEIRAIRMPAYYQISLEGLEAHNDVIRGKGHFRRSLNFLGILKKLEVPSTVMLTLTRDNMSQVLPLAELLHGLADEFTYNRLSRMGEGAGLAAVDPEEYASFLEEYHHAAEHNSLLGIKDSLFNIIRLREEKSLLGGCAGYGCGAAFNFLALLPDGEVHACRKFPSLLGSLHSGTLSQIYDSEAAARYRAGSTSCRDCPLVLVCRGCPAAVFSSGGDVFTEADPCCFLEKNF